MKEEEKKPKRRQSHQLEIEKILAHYAGGTVVRKKRAMVGLVSTNFDRRFNRSIKKGKL